MQRIQRPFGPTIGLLTTPLMLGACGGGGEDAGTVLPSEPAGTRPEVVGPHTFPALPGPRTQDATASPILALGQTLQIRPTIAGPHARDRSSLAPVLEPASAPSHVTRSALEHPKPHGSRGLNLAMDRCPQDAIA